MAETSDKVNRSERQRMNEGCFSVSLYDEIDSMQIKICAQGTNNTDSVSTIK